MKTYNYTQKNYRTGGIRQKVQLTLLSLLACYFTIGETLAQTAQQSTSVSAHSSIGNATNAAEGLISGVVMDNEQKPVDLATVRLIRLPKISGDQTAAAQEEVVVSSTYSDVDGSYAFQSITPGTYRISVSLLGHATEVSDPIIVGVGSNSSSKVNFSLSISSNQLEAVTITAERPLIERRPDMLVVNVENSAMAAGNSALDILQRSPGVTLDKDDNLSLMGKQGVTVMIDGKQTHLSSSQLADLLRNTDGNSIRSIELITNPSSKYDASGSAGMINIVLKKNRLAGTTGSATLSGGYGMKHKSNASLNLSHKSEKVNVYGMLSYMNHGGGQEINIDRNVENAEGSTSLIQRSNLGRKGASFSYRTGVDLHTSERNTFSVLVNGYRTDNSISNDSWTGISSFSAAVDSNLHSVSFADGNFNSIGGNINNQFLIDDKGRKLVADLDISQFANNRLTDYNNTFFLPSGDQKDEPYLSRSSTPTSIGIRIAKLDYTHPITEKSSLETGLKYSWVQSDNDMRYDQYVGGSWQRDLGRSNHFLYTEQVSAAYASYKNQFGKLGVQTGLRAEYSVTDGNSLTISNRVKRDYLDIFPTLFLSYAVTDNHQTGISYSKRINRPNYQLLNPFSYFLDQYTYETGNPYLQPEYAHVIDASYSFKSKYHLSAGFSFTNDAIVETMVQNDETKAGYVSRDNLARQNIYYANLNVPFKIAKFWNTNTNINSFYMGFDGMLNGSQLKQGQFAYQIRNNHNFSILPTLTAEASLHYQSALVYSIYNIKDQWALDLGMTKSMMDKRGNIKLSVSDLFNTRVQRISSNYSNLNVHINQKNETRIVRLSFSYSFGNMKNRVQQRESRSEEKNRVAMP